MTVNYYYTCRMSNVMSKLTRRGVCGILVNVGDDARIADCEHAHELLPESHARYWLTGVGSGEAHSGRLSTSAAGDFNLCAAQL